MTKTARSMAGLPWIAAMAFFMQALDATILNTAPGHQYATEQWADNRADQAWHGDKVKHRE